MEKKNVKLVVAITAVMIIFLAVDFVVVGWIIGTPETPTCIHATRENGRYDVNNDDQINYQDSGIIWNNGVEEMGENYTYNMTYDMNCDEIVNAIDSDLCWQNRD